jgi:hypothetical protein
MTRRRASEAKPDNRTALREGMSVRFVLGDFVSLPGRTTRTPCPVVRRTCPGLSEPAPHHRERFFPQGTPVGQRLSSFALASRAGLGFPPEDEAASCP